MPFLIFSQPLFFMQNYYSQTAQGYNELHGTEQKKKAELINSRMDFSGLLLDIGAGTGISTKEFSRTVETIALDPSIEMLKQAPGLKVCARAEELPFKENVFDSIVSLTALHHADIEKAFSEIQRVSGKEAKIAVSFFRRAKKLGEAKRIFRDFQSLEQAQDLVFFSPI